MFQNKSAIKVIQKEQSSLSPVGNWTALPQTLQHSAFLLMLYVSRYPYITDKKVLQFNNDRLKIPFSVKRSMDSEQTPFFFFLGNRFTTRLQPYPRNLPDYHRLFSRLVSYVCVQIPSLLYQLFTYGHLPAVFRFKIIVFAYMFCDLPYRLVTRLRTWIARPLSIRACHSIPHTSYEE